MTLLDTGSGTDTANAVVTTLDSFALSGLTALDTLVMYVSFEATTQIALTPRITNTTDSVVITQSSSNVAAGGGKLWEVRIRQAQSANTKVLGIDSSDLNAQTLSTFTTAWTGAWTIALRYGGMNGAGGTLNWSWALYKIAGQ